MTGASAGLTTPVSEKTYVGSNASTNSLGQIFVGAIFCMLSGGTVYWYPAVAQGLSTHLSLSDVQTTAVVSAIYSGSLLGFVGGLIHTRFGSRLTPMFGAFLTSLSYFSLGLLVHLQPSTIAFPCAFLLSISIVTSSYIVYGSAMATAAGAFPPSQRGRVMGFLSSIYGMSSGVCGVLHSALFPRLKDTEMLLYFVAAFVALPVPMSMLLFPHTVSTSSTHSSSTKIAAPSSQSETHARMVSIAYAVAITIVADLQVAAYCGWEGNVYFAGIRGELVCAVLLVLLLAVFPLLPFTVRSHSANAGTSAEREALLSVCDDECRGLEGQAYSAWPFWKVLRDFRYQLMVFTFFALPGGGSTTVLVNATGIAASSILSQFSVTSTSVTAEDVSILVRALVVAFSACNVTARLIAGLISDRGSTRKEREGWKVGIMAFTSGLMACALVTVAFSSGWLLIAAVGVIGYAHGTFFAISPTLVANWFGVESFPLNFAVVGAGMTIAAATVCSCIPFLVAASAMSTSFKDVQTSLTNVKIERFCVGMACYVPSLMLVAGINTLGLILYVSLRKRFLAAV